MRLGRVSFGGFSLVIGLGILAVLGQTRNVAAEAPMQRTQAPGYQRVMVGDVEVTALFDGIVPLDTRLLLNVAEKDVGELTARALIGDSRKIPTSTNVFAIDTGSKLVLVDAGGGKGMKGMKGMGAALGLATDNLRAAGYRPEEVDAVLITHLHGDHIGGLVDAKGKAAFPNAVVYLAKAENDYWMSEAEPKVPDMYKEHLKQARMLVQSVADPYLKAGRWKTFDCKSDCSPIPGIRAHASPGHTPGHTAYEVESRGAKLVIIGDTVHIGAVQFARPEAAVLFDANPKEAVVTREALFRRIADGKTLVADMHIAFPGIGRMRSDGKKGYQWVPIEYMPLPTVERVGK